MDSIQTLQKELSDLEAEHSSLWKSIEKLVKKKEKITKQLGKLQAENFEFTIENIMGLDWDGPLVSTKYSELKDWLYKEFKYLYPSGYYPESSQVAFSIRLMQNMTEEEINLAARELNVIETLLKTKNKKFKIFEHTLSEHGIYQFDYNTLTLSQTVYGHTKTVKTFQTLPKALKYISKHHYYQERRDED